MRDFALSFAFAMTSPLVDMPILFARSTTERRRYRLLEPSVSSRVPNQDGYNFRREVSSLTDGR
jgi:hypothetical protein